MRWCARHSQWHWKEQPEYGSARYPSNYCNFEQLSKGFIRHFIRGQRHKKPTGHLLNIQQAEEESLRQYVTQFNKELLQVDDAEDQVILTTFQAGLLLRDFSS